MTMSHSRIKGLILALVATTSGCDCSSPQLTAPVPLSGDQPTNEEQTPESQMPETRLPEELVLTGTHEEVLEALTESYRIVGSFLADLPDEPASTRARLEELRASLFDIVDFARYSEQHPLERNPGLMAAALVLFGIDQGTLRQSAQFWRRSVNGTWPSMPTELREAVQSLDDACIERFPLGYPQELAALVAWRTPRCWPVDSDDGSGGLTTRILESQPSDLPPIQVEGGSAASPLSSRIIRQHVARNMVAFLGCFERTSDEPPDSPGLLAIRFEISESGTVSSATVDRSELETPRVGNCVADVIRRMHFLVSDDAAPQTVVYTFRVYEMRVVSQPYTEGQPPYFQDRSIFAF